MPYESTVYVRKQTDKISCCRDCAIEFLLDIGYTLDKATAAIGSVLQPNGLPYSPKVD